MFPKQTGGDKRHWLYDPSSVHEIPQIQKKLVVNDHYSVVPSQDYIVTFILDHLMNMLPAEESEAVRMIHIGGMTLRASGRELKVDHKTVKARAERGLTSIKRKIAETPWLKEFLNNEMFEDEVPADILEAKKMFYQLFKENNDE